MTFDNFKRGKRCPICRREEASLRFRHSFSYVSAYFESHGCKLLSEQYRNHSEKLTYVCECGKTAQIRFSDFLCGKRCSACALQKKIDFMQRNNRIPTSSQQEYLASLFGGELNYRINSSFVDLAFPEKRIY